MTTGGTQADFTSLLGLVSSGDEVLLADPGWPNFEMAVLAVGAVPVRYPLHLDDGFIPQLDEIEALITPRSRLLIVNSPGNPTARFSQLRRLLGWLRWLSGTIYGVGRRGLRRAGLRRPPREPDPVRRNESLVSTVSPRPMP